MSAATERGNSAGDGSGTNDGGGANDGDDADEELSGREIDRRPAPLSAVVAVAAGAITAIAAGAGSVAGGALAGVGTAVLVPGVLVGDRRFVHAGAFALLGGVVLGGSGDAPELWLLTATVAAVVAWDAGQNAISLGEQLGREADTARAEIAHSGATVAVGATSATVAYVLYLLAGGNQPLGAVVLLLVAVAVLVGALR